MLHARHHPDMPLLGFSKGRPAIIHRTVRCAPDMSGEAMEER
jgi:hypothetical protein